MSAELKENLRLRRNLCMQYRNSYFDTIRLFGATMFAMITTRCNQRDMRLAVEAEKAIVAHAADGGNKVDRRLRTLLELQSVLCMEYRNAYFAIIKLIGPGVFNLTGDHHHQHDGVIEAEAAVFDDMVEKIRSAAK